MTAPVDTEERARRMRRVLYLTRLGHGTLTVTHVKGRTGWSERSVQRYFRDLQAEGLIDRVGATNSYRWKITETGLAELSA